MEFSTAARKRPFSTCADDVSICQSRSSSTFQRFTSSRLNVARPSRWRRSKASTASSSTYSASDAGEPDTPVSCVTRETACDGCAFNRFMVWVAVKRNNNPILTPEQKLECPLVSCRRVFPNHELMLQHVYECEYLESKQYYCYDCRHEERFDDAKCKKCSGHPAKFRKLFSLTRYKQLFSSMGRKSRKEAAHRPQSCVSIQGVPSGGGGGGGGGGAAGYAPSSFGFEDALHTTQAELSSTAEILELDSREVPIWPFSTTNDDEAEDALAAETAAFPMTMANLEASAAELASDTQTEIWWRGPVNCSLPDDLSRKPALQVNTIFHAQNAKAKTRSVKLAPSSSVRSNASGNSFMTNASGNSFLSSTMSSSCMSPTMSSWSGQWNSRFAGTDSSLASPISPLDQLAGSFQTNPDFCFPTARDECEPDQMLRGITSVPQGAATCGLAFPGTLPFALDQSFAPSSSSSGQLSRSSSAHSTASARRAAVARAETSADSLAKKAFRLLETHVAVSKDTLREMGWGSGPVTRQFLDLDVMAVASRGYTCLKALVERQQQTDPVNLLSAVHVSMAWAVALDETDGPKLSKRIAIQAHRYGAWAATESQQEYRHIVDVLWDSSSESGSRSQHGSSEGPIVRVARLFLDRMDYLVLKAGPENIGSPTRIDGTKATVLRKEHHERMNQDTSAGFEAAFASIVNILGQEFGNQYPALNASLRKVLGLFKTESISWTRKIEIELVNAGLYHMPLDIVVCKYGPFIRRQLEALFVNKTPRSAYYALLFAAIEKRSEELSAVVPTLPTSLPEPTEPEPETTTSKPTGTVHPYDGLDMFGNMDAPRSDLKSESPADPAGGLFIGISGTGFEPDLPTTMPTFPQTIMMPIAHNEPNLLSASWNDADLLIDSMSLLPYAEDLPPFLPEALTPSTNPMPSSSTSPTTDVQMLHSPESTSSRHTRAASDAMSSDHRSSKRRKVSPPGDATQRGPQCRFPGCDYAPNGDPKWWKGSMDKHIKNQHSSSSKIFKCDYPGCKSEFKNRHDNLKAHKKEKGHWTEGDGRPPEKGSRG